MWRCRQPAVFLQAHVLPRWQNRLLSSSPSGTASSSSPKPSAAPNKSKIFADAATVAKVRALKQARISWGGSTHHNRFAVTLPKRNLLITMGLPFVLFSVLAAWVVSNALDGRLKEMEVSQGKSTQSLRQAALEAEHEDMMERLNKIVKDDSYDNTKRIKRPEEVLEERRLERQRRNAWHRRLYRSVFGEERENK